MSAIRVGVILRHIRKIVTVSPVDAESDRELLGRFACQRDEAAFATLVRRHGPLLLGVCRRVLANEHDAEEIVQATFLILARKAGSLGWRESVGPWLYQVAYRLAVRARMAAARRRAREDRCPIKGTPDPLAEITMREGLAVLDDELARLPRCYRAPLLLCCPEGATRDEAARQFGWSLATLKRRLESARERLRVRLLRRGLTLSAAFAAATVAEGAPSAGVPAALVTASVAGARAVSAGRLTILFSAATAAFVERVTKALVPTWAKAALTLFLVLGVVGAGAVAYRLCGLAAEDLSEGNAVPISSPFTGQLPPPNQPEAPAAKAGEAATVGGNEGRRRRDQFDDPLPEGALLRLGTLRLRHAGVGPNSILFSRNGKTLITGGGEKVVLWDVASGAELRRLQAPGDRITALALSPYGKRLAWGGQEKVRLCDLDTGQELSALAGQSVLSLAFAPDGQTLVLASGDRRASETRLWDTATGQEHRRITGHAGGFDLAAYTPDGRYLVLASTEGRKVLLADGGTGSPIRTYQPPGWEGRAIALAPSGQALAFAGHQEGGGGLAGPRLLDLATGRGLRKFVGHEQSVWALAFTPDGKTLASASYDQTVRLWEVATGREKGKFRTGPGWPQGLAFDPDGKVLAAVRRDSAIQLWDVATGRALLRREGHEGDVSGVAFAPDGRTLATCSFSDHSVRLWDAVTGEPRHVLRGHESYVRSVAFLPDGKTLLSGGGDGTVRLWDTATGQELRRFTLYETSKGESKQQVLSMCLSTDGRRLMAVGTGSEIRQNQSLTGWDVATGKRLFRREEAGFDSPTAGPDATTLAMRDPNGIALRDVATGKLLLTLPAASSKLLSPYVFSPNGSFLAVRGFNGAAREGIIYVYALPAGKLRRQIPVGLNEHALAFSPDSRTVASADGTGLIRLWEIASGAERC
jgi:RNA polymerase sigma factor (sigma-70 family)